MDPNATRGFRAAIVARARFIEDLIVEQAARVGQYVILGAGLDTFAQRRSQLAAQLDVFEIDQPRTQAWKRRRLLELSYPIADWLRLVPVDFEAGQSWWEQLIAAGFNPSRPAVVVSTGVTMYLSKPATVQHVPGKSLAERYFADRPDGLRPSTGEDFLLATT